MSYDYGIAIDRLGLLVLSTESEECNSPFFVSLTDLCETESARSLSPLRAFFRLLFRSPEVFAHTHIYSRAYSRNDPDVCARAVREDAARPGRGRSRAGEV